MPSRDGASRMGEGGTDCDRIRRGNLKRRQSREEQELLVQSGLGELFSVQSERQKLAV